MIAKAPDCHPGLRVGAFFRCAQIRDLLGSGLAAKMVRSKSHRLLSCPVVVEPGTENGRIQLGRHMSLKYIRITGAGA